MGCGCFCVLIQALISGKKVQFRKPAPGAADAVPSRKRATPINLASAIRKSSGGGASSVVQRPFRDRVLHLLALRPYRKAELLLRLQKDGLTQADKDTLDSLLQQVGTDQPDLMCCKMLLQASQLHGSLRLILLRSSMPHPPSGVIPADLHGTQTWPVAITWRLAKSLCLWLVVSPALHIWAMSSCSLSTLKTSWGSEK